MGAHRSFRASHEKNQARGLTDERELAVVREDFKCCFHAVSIAERVRHPLSYPKDLEEPNRIRRSVTLACLGLHDAIDGGVRTHHVSHDNFLAPVRASVELHHYRHRCCFNFHAVSIAERVGHSLSYPKDFCDLFQSPRNCDEGGFMRRLAAMLTTERSVVVSDLLHRLGEVGVASEYAEVTHGRNFRLCRFNFDTVQFRFHAQRITETETNTRKIAPPHF